MLHIYKRKHIREACIASRMLHESVTPLDIMLPNTDERVIADVSKWSAKNYKAHNIIYRERYFAQWAC